MKVAIIVINGVVEEIYSDDLKQDIEIIYIEDDAGVEGTTRNPDGLLKDKEIFLECLKRQTLYYWDKEGFKNGGVVCYIPKNEITYGGGEGYTRADFIRLTKGEENLAKKLFYQCEEHEGITPETLLEEWRTDIDSFDDIENKNVNECNKKCICCSCDKDQLECEYSNCKGIIECVQSGEKVNICKGCVGCGLKENQEEQNDKKFLTLNWHNSDLKDVLLQAGYDDSEENVKRVVEAGIIEGLKSTLIKTAYDSMSDSLVEVEGLEIGN